MAELLAASFLERWRNLNSVFLDILMRRGPPGSAALTITVMGRQIARVSAGMPETALHCPQIPTGCPRHPGLKSSVFNLLEGLRDVLPDSTGHS